jgi:hypothetical protein
MKFVKLFDNIIVSDCSTFDEKLSAIRRVLYDKAGKKRSILMYGEASCGKSLLTSIMCSVYDQWQVGNFVMQASKSQFWLQGLINKSIYVGEEIQPDHDQAQILKLLMEGSPMTTTDVKFCEPVILVYRPVIVTGNRPIWFNCIAERGPFLERSVRLEFMNKIKTNITRDRQSQARAWTYLLSKNEKRHPDDGEEIIKMEPPVLLY